MASMAETSICAEKSRLTGEIVAAFHAVNDLHNREIEDLVKGGTGMDRFDIAIKRARERRDEAKMALLEHTQEHGC